MVTIRRAIVEETGAHSTDMQSPETVDHLCSKCDDYAENWKDTAERLWAAGHIDKKARHAQAKEQ